MTEDSPMPQAKPEDAPLTAEELAQLERLHKAATPGDWVAFPNDADGTAWSVDSTAGERVLYDHAPHRLVNKVPSEVTAVIADDFRDWRDAEFVEAARNLLPRLLAEVRRRRETQADAEARRAADEVLAAERIRRLTGEDWNARDGDAGAGERGVGG